MDVQAVRQWTLTRSLYLNSRRRRRRRRRDRLVFLSYMIRIPNFYPVNVWVHLYLNYIMSGAIMANKWWTWDDLKRKRCIIMEDLLITCLQWIRNAPKRAVGIADNWIEHLMNMSIECKCCVNLLVRLLTCMFLPFTVVFECDEAWVCHMYVYVLLNVGKST
jgi:hypothetical protein